MSLPRGAIPMSAEEQVQPSRTYYLDTRKNRIIGTVDGTEAVKQAIYKMLQTERFAYEIYSRNYGAERSLQWEQQITEALLQDERIERIEDMQIQVSGDSARASFTVYSIFGQFPTQGEIAYV